MNDGAFLGEGFGLLSISFVARPVWYDYMNRTKLAYQLEAGMQITIVDEVVEQLEGRPHDRQSRAPEFIRALAASVPGGVAGRRLMQCAGTISPRDAEGILVVI
ncbi:MAG: hypothetical protein KA586_05095 [Candidatus Promineofilum sp.]|nr:hypothetical protein [Promineifilum sp.]